jgi:hypothetical protein
MKTMLQLIQAASQEMGITSPTLVTGSTVQDTIQLGALLNRVLDNLQRDYIWQFLTTEYRFTTQFLTATGTLTNNSPIITGLSATTGLDSTYQVIATGVNQDVYVSTLDSSTQVTMTQAATASGTVTINFCKTKYALPADYDRQNDRTQWDKTQHWEMLGPETGQQWQWLKSGYIATGPRIRWRILGGTFQIWPAISTHEYLGFEYISNAPVLSNTAVRKQYFTADTDTCAFPDGLMILGLKNEYYKAKGFGDQFKDEFENMLSIAKANDQGSATLQMAPEPLDILIGWENIPDSKYGQ